MRLARDEHFVPTGTLDLESYVEAGDYLGVHHLVRYAWAEKYLRSLPPVPRLLDLGCGDGYGTFRLARALPETQLLGCDYDGAAVESAERRYVLPNLRFRFGDGTEWEESIGRDSYDVIVCFDVLEHVDHREIFMESLVSHLSPDGRLLFSTPCAADWNDFQPAWEHHRLEYSARSLFDFIHRYFREVRRPDSGTLPEVDVFGQLRGSGVTYPLKMNPLLCEGPIQFSNPYPASKRPAAPREAPSESAPAVSPAEGEEEASAPASDDRTDSRRSQRDAFLRQLPPATSSGNFLRQLPPATSSGASAACSHGSESLEGRSRGPGHRPVARVIPTMTRGNRRPYATRVRTFGSTSFQVVWRATRSS